MSADQRTDWIQKLQRLPEHSDADMRATPRLQHWELASFVESIDRFNASQPNAPMLDEIRSYNHFIAGEFNKMRALRGASILDIGASPHSYAMEKCFELGVFRYVGVGLDIESDVSMLVEGAEGHLLYMNAESLAFEDGSFDCVVSMSTFEHIGDVSLALSEIERVLKPEGTALITFEPLWSCAYGHHLHHLGEVVARAVPPWAHLVCSREEVREQLIGELANRQQPQDAEQLLSLMFEDGFINRIGIGRMRDLFLESSMKIEWMLPMMHDRIDHPFLELAQEKTGLSADDLHTKGLSILLNKRSAGTQ